MVLDDTKRSKEVRPSDSRGVTKYLGKILNQPIFGYFLTITPKFSR
jgi:hypothetical protein